MKIKYWMIYLFCSILFACTKDEIKINEPLPLNISFQKNIGGSSDDVANSIVIKDDTLYILGNGDLISEQIIGGSQNDWGQDIVEYKSFYFIVGHSNSYGTGDNDAYIVKLKK